MAIKVTKTTKKQLAAYAEKIKEATEKLKGLAKERDKGAK